MSTLASRLRAACAGYPAAQIKWPHRLLHEAADAIASLSEENARLTATLKPFAEMARRFEPYPNTPNDFYVDVPDVRLGHLRSAAAAISSHQRANQGE